MKMPGVSRRLTVAAAATVLLGGLGGVALAASSPAATGSSTTINGCYNTTTGALRVLTPRNRTCKGQHKISWNQTGNGYNFIHTAGALNHFGFGEADGPVLEQAGNYYVVLQTNVDISGLTAGTPDNCFLDLTKNGVSFLRRLYSSFIYPFTGSTSPFGPGQFPDSLTGIVNVPNAWARTQLYVICQAGSGTTEVKSASWWVSPVAGTTSGKVSISTAIAHNAGRARRGSANGGAKLAG